MIINDVERLGSLRDQEKESWLGNSDRVHIYEL